MEEKIKAILKAIIKEEKATIEDIILKRDKNHNIYFVKYKIIINHEYTDYVFGMDCFVSLLKREMIKKDILIISKANTPFTFSCKIKYNKKTILKHIGKNESENIINAVYQLIEQTDISK